MFAANMCDISCCKCECHKLMQIYTMLVIHAVIIQCQWHRDNYYESYDSSTCNYNRCISLICSPSTTIVLCYFKWSAKLITRLSVVAESRFGLRSVLFFVNVVNLISPGWCYEYEYVTAVTPRYSEFDWSRLTGVGRRGRSTLTR